MCNISDQSLIDDYAGGEAGRRSVTVAVPAKSEMLRAQLLHPCADSDCKPRKGSARSGPLYYSAYAKSKSITHTSEEQTT